MLSRRQKISSSIEIINKPAIAQLAERRTVEFIQSDP